MVEKKNFHQIYEERRRHYEEEEKESTAAPLSREKKTWQ